MLSNGPLSEYRVRTPSAPPSHGKRENRLPGKADDWLKAIEGQAPALLQADVKDPQKAEAVYKVIRERLEKYQKERPGGYLVREAPAEDVKQLKLLVGH